jgi:hypothetical protein
MLSLTHEIRDTLRSLATRAMCAVITVQVCEQLRDRTVQTPLKLPDRGQIIVRQILLDDGASQSILDFVH